MQSLLDPAPISRSEAVERCARYLRGRSRQSILVRPFAGSGTEHATAILAYAGVLLDAAEAAGPAARRRRLDELSTELERALEARPQAALGHALSATVRLEELGAHLLRGPLEEIRNHHERRSFETRQAMLSHAQRIARPLGRALLAVSGHSSEKNEVLIDALATAVLLTRWSVRFRQDWDQGRLNLPVEELARAGIPLQSLDFAKPSELLRPVVADQIRWVRTLFHKGWELSTTLGWWRGRVLAFCLRWHAASLSALEARRYDVSRGTPPAGFLRFLACAAASVITRRPPHWTNDLRST